MEGTTKHPKKAKRTTGISTLTDLHGTIIRHDDGTWIKIEAWTVLAKSEIPHGIRYSLTLHDKSGTRLLGYDNAHAVAPANPFKFAGQILAYDHKHRHARDKGVPYAFKDAYQLLKDFYTDVDRVLAQHLPKQPKKP